MAAENGSITVEIDPMKELPSRYLGSDEDGPHYGPVTLLDAIVDTAANRLLDFSDKELRKRVSKVLDERIEEVLAQKLPEVIDSVLEGAVTITDEWGTAKESGVTVRELILKKAREELVYKERGGFGRDTALSKAVNEQISYSLSKDLADAVAQAKKQIIAKLTEATSTELAKSIEKAVRTDARL